MLFSRPRESLGRRTLARRVESATACTSRLLGLGMYRTELQMLVQGYEMG